MPALTRQPTNINFLTNQNFRFLLKRAPNVTFFVSRYQFPSYAVNPVQRTTQLNPIPEPGDKLWYGDLSITFNVDEDLKNYLEIVDWMTYLGHPTDYDQYKVLSDRDFSRMQRASGEGVKSDATLMILTSAKNPNYEIHFWDIWPTSLTGLEGTSEAPESEIQKATVVFKIRHYTYEWLREP